MMKIVKAEPGEYQKIRSFYHSLIDALEGLEYAPAWKKDVYPSPEGLKEAVEQGWLYYAEDNERIMASMALNHKCNEAYKNVQWSVNAGPEKIMAVHMLGVHRDFTCRGIGKAMVRFALARAKETGMKTVRLDVWKGNLPAEKLYEGFGFKCAATVPMYYEDTGWTDFRLYEYLIV